MNIRNIYIVLVLSLSCCVNVLANGQWFNPTGRDVRTIFYQGNNASQIQLSKYTGNRGFIATTGEHVICRRAIDIIEQPFLGIEISQVQLKKVYRGSGAFFKNLGFALQHPIAAITQGVTYLKNKSEHIDVHGGHGKSETVACHAVDISSNTIGQEVDIRDHQRRYNMCVNQYPNSDLILFGPSRGAATTLSAAAVNEYDCSKIKLIVLEGCFDSVTEVITAKCPKLMGNDKVKAAALWLVSQITSHKPDGLSPISLVNNFPEGVPVLFITSRKDKVVPMQCTQRVIDTLQARGKNPIYRLVLQQSSHSGYMMDNREDAQNYRDCMHTLYKSLNLPYIPEYASAGECKGLLASCRVN